MTEQMYGNQIKATFGNKSLTAIPRRFYLERYGTRYVTVYEDTFKCLKLKRYINCTKFYVKKVGFGFG
jgi:hypothetical protein